MRIWCSRVINANGTEDMEFLDKEPTMEFIDGLFDAYRDGLIQGFIIREGNLNGGDSIIVFSSFSD